MIDEAKLMEEADKALAGSHPWVSGTRVGCAIIAECQDGTVQTFSGANIEGQWMTSIHAEVSALSRMVNGGGRRILEVAIVAPQCERFTPCGACLDWLMQFSDKKTVLLSLGKDGAVKRYYVSEMYPQYPTK